MRQRGTKRDWGKGGGQFWAYIYLGALQGHSTKMVPFFVIPPSFYFLSLLFHQHYCLSLDANKDDHQSAKLDELRRNGGGNEVVVQPKGIDLRRTPFTMPPQGISPKNVRRCQFTNGTLWHSATDCEDELEPEACSNIFGKGKPRPTLCLNSELADLAKRCAKTCRLCCETPKFNCADSGAHLMDCHAHREKCKEPTWRRIMMAVCEQTCGLCSAENCFDLAPDCPSLRPLCFNRPISPLFRQQCPLTCGLCEPRKEGGTKGEKGEGMGGGVQKAPREVIVLVRRKGSGQQQKCEDLSPSCADNVQLCTDENYSKLFEEKCAKTCGHCKEEEGQGEEEEEMVDSIKRIRHGEARGGGGGRGGRMMERPTARMNEEKRKSEKVEERRPIIVIDNRQIFGARRRRKEMGRRGRGGGGEMVKKIGGGRGGMMLVQADQVERQQWANPLIVMVGGKMTKEAIEGMRGGLVVSGDEEEEEDEEEEKTNEQTKESEDGRRLDEDVEGEGDVEGTVSESMEEVLEEEEDDDEEEDEEEKLEGDNEGGDEGKKEEVGSNEEEDEKKEVEESRGGGEDEEKQASEKEPGIANESKEEEKEEEEETANEGNEEGKGTIEAGNERRRGDGTKREEDGMMMVESILAEKEEEVKLMEGRKNEREERRGFRLEEKTKEEARALSEGILDILKGMGGSEEEEGEGGRGRRRRRKRGLFEEPSKMADLWRKRQLWEEEEMIDQIMRKSGEEEQWGGGGEGREVAKSQIEPKFDEDEEEHEDELDADEESDEEDGGSVEEEGFDEEDEAVEEAEEVDRFRGIFEILREKLVNKEEWDEEEEEDRGAEDKGEEKEEEDEADEGEDEEDDYLEEKASEEKLEGADEMDDIEDIFAVEKMPRQLRRLEKDEKIKEELAMAGNVPALKNGGELAEKEGGGKGGRRKKKNGAAKIIRVKIRPNGRRKNGGKKEEDGKGRGSSTFDGILRDRLGKALKIEEMRGGIGGILVEIRKRYGLGNWTDGEEAGRALLETGRDIRAELGAILRELHQISGKNEEEEKETTMGEGREKRGERDAEEKGKKRRIEGKMRKNTREDDDEVEKEEDGKRGKNGQAILKALERLLGMAAKGQRKRAIEKNDGAEEKDDGLPGAEELLEMLRKRMAEKGPKQIRKKGGEQRQAIQRIAIVGRGGGGEEGTPPTSNLRLVQLIGLPGQKMPPQILVQSDGRRFQPFNGQIVLSNGAGNQQPQQNEGPQQQPQQQSSLIVAPQPMVVVQKPPPPQQPPQQPMGPPQQQPPQQIVQPPPQPAPQQPPQQQVLFQPPPQQQFVPPPQQQPPQQQVLFQPPIAVQSPQPAPQQFIVQRPLPARQLVLVQQPRQPRGGPFSVVRGTRSAQRGDVCRDYYPYCQQIVPHGFCNSEFYPMRMKREFCPQSCNLC